MNPFPDNVVMGGEDCQAVCKLSSDITSHWLFDIVQLWNENREHTTVNNTAHGTHRLYC